MRHIRPSSSSTLLDGRTTNLLVVTCLIVLCVFPATPVRAMSEAARVASDERCLEKTMAGRPSLALRFPVGEVKAHCRAGTKWRSEFLDSLARSSSKSKPSSMSLTGRQQRWLDDYWRCNDTRCLCGLVEPCARRMMRLRDDVGEHLFTNNLKSNSKLSSTRRERQQQQPNEQHLLSTTRNNTTLGGSRQKRQQPNEKHSFTNRKRQKRQQQQQQPLLGKAVRKEVRTLSAAERQRLFDALNRLRAERIDSLTKYDILIAYHTPERAPEAHFCAAFLPYHRELLKVVEMAVRSVDSDIALPYWDTTLDEPLPEPRDSIVWSNELFGDSSANADDTVIDGPFARWTTMNDARVGQLSPTTRRIVRRLGAAPYGGLIAQRDLDELMHRASAYRHFVYCVDPFFELVHGGAHLWVGGHMLELRVSPNDPVFFFYHTFVDWIWEQWRQTKQNRQERATQYVSEREACSAICQGHLQMSPFPITIADGLSNSYTDNLYEYAARPWCSPEKRHCGSEFLFCDQSRYICISKVKPRGNCSGLERWPVCYKGTCVRGRCVPDPVTTVGPLPAPTAPRSVEPATVWIAITVQTTSSVSITTTHLAGDSGGSKLQGELADPSLTPYYEGAAYARLNNPRRSSTRVVEALIEVSDARTGATCVPFCLVTERYAYEQCRARVKLYAGNAGNSDNIDFASSLELARQLSWRNGGRIADRFWFVCPVPAAEEPPHPTTTTTTQVMTTAANAAPQIRLLSCINTHRCCVSWATPQRCQSISWMQNICPRSCRLCSNDDEPSEEDCSDYNPYCPRWAAANQCSQNPLWMEENCRLSCNICQRSRAVLNAICGEIPTREAQEDCNDQHEHCVAWSQRNECRLNPRWMSIYCRRSCNLCSENLAKIRRF